MDQLLRSAIDVKVDAVCRQIAVTFYAYKVALALTLLHTGAYPWRATALSRGGEAEERDVVSLPLID